MAVSPSTAVAVLLGLSLAAGYGAAQVPARRDSAARRDSTLRRDSSQRRDSTARRDSTITDESIRNQLQRDPQNPLVHLTVGRWYRRQSTSWLRARADGHYRDAARLAHALGNRRVEADAEAELAHTAWVRYEQLAHRYTVMGDVTQIDPLRAIGDWRYIGDFFDKYAHPDSSGYGDADYSNAEDHARAALVAVPGHPVATGVLAVILGDRNRWEELEAPARAAIRAFPQDPQGYRALGLALTRLKREAEAARAFDAALLRMDSTQRAPYENLSQILRHAGREKYDSLRPAQRAELRQLYWAVAQPLALDSVNQVLVEFYARVTYVDLRWTAPDEGVVGWDSDRGKVFIRYGPPDIWGVLSPTPAGSELSLDDGDMPLIGARMTTVWAYRQSHARFIFQNQRGYTTANLASEFPMYAREVYETAPVLFENVPGMATMDTILAQLAQFRGPAGGTTLAVFGFVPVGRMLRGVPLREARLELAAIVKDGRMRDVTRRVRTETVPLQGADSNQLARQSWRLDLFPSTEYLLRLEARQVASQAAARSIIGLDIRRYGPGALALSDMIVADRVAPRDSTPRRWTDFLIDPSVGLVRRGAPVAFLWEMYNLSADSTGTGRYRVELAITNRTIERRGLAARIVGGVRDAVGLSARGDSIAVIGFNRQTPVRGRVAFPEYLTIELGDAPEGLYGVSLTVTDLTTNQTATTRRQFTVTNHPEEIPRRPL